MSQYIINTGNIANDGQGDPLRTAFTDTNLNFNQIWAAGPVNSNIKIANNTIITTNTNGNLILATNGIGAIVTAQSVVPDLSNVRMVGGPNNRFNTVYSQYLDISGIVTAGNLSVSGNLYVAGNTVTVNQSNLSVSNTLITLAANATIPVEADGGGIFIAGANASLTYSSSLNSWVSNIALSVQGNVSADYFVGDGSGLSNLNVSVDANALTGNRLNSGVVFSNLTTVGTLTSLTVDGNILAGNITATFYGDGSNLSNLGNVANAVYATFAGTAATANLAAQAVTAINADTALYAVNANTANTANFALTSNCAIYANTATTAILANSAIVANVALFAESVGVLSNLSVTGNIVTGGILTNNYYYANGTPFAGGGSGSIIQSPTAPLNPTASTLWWDEVSGRLYVYYDDGTSSQWVDAAPAGTGGGGSGTASLIQSPTAPLNPTANTLWWDEVSGRLYVYYNDGTSSQWVDASPAGTGGNINLTNVSSNIIPSANLVYSLGNATNQWKDLWVSGNTIYINSVPITVDGNTLQVAGANVVTGNVAPGGATDWANIGNINNANGPTTIAIGGYAGNAQGSFSVAVGYNAGNVNQGEYAEAIGISAGQTSQGARSVALGAYAGQTSQGTYSVAIGGQAGGTGQGNTAVAIGSSAGEVSQGTSAVAVGGGAGQTNQSGNAISIGVFAGGTRQGNSAIALGYQAGYTDQGNNAIAIGKVAGRNSQANNTIILNATGNILNSVANQTDSFYVAPVRNDTGNTTNALYYNTSTKEISYGPAGSGGNTGNITFTNANISTIITEPIQLQPLDSNLSNIAGANVYLQAGDYVYLDGQPQPPGPLPAPGGTLYLQGGNSAITYVGPPEDRDYIGGLGGNVVITTTIAGNNSNPSIRNSNNWTFDRYGNLILPAVRNNGTATPSINYANGQPYGVASYTAWANIVNINNVNGPLKIAIGQEAANINQGTFAIAIGASAAASNQGDSAVAVGTGAGQTSQGNNAIAIGRLAGGTNQAANTIILNATGVAVNGVANVANAFYVAPVRNDTANITNALYYNTTTFEISYGPAGGNAAAAGNAGDIQINVAGNIGADSTLRYVDNGGEMTLYADYLNAPGVFTSDIYAGDGTPSNITLTTSYGNATWNFGSDGNTLFPGNLGFQGTWINNTAGGELYISPQDGNVLLALPGDTDSATVPVRLANFGNGTVQILSGPPENQPWTFGSDGNLTTPGNINFTNNAAIQLNPVTGVTIYGNSVDQATALMLNDAGDAALYANANVTINSNSQGSNPQWIFDTDGNLTIPGAIRTVSNSQLELTESANTAYLGTTADDSTALYLTATTAQLYANGEVSISSNVGGGNAYGWAFDVDGNTNIPGDIISFGNIGITTNVGNTTQSWTFDDTGNLTLPVGTPSINYANGQPYGGTGGSANIIYNGLSNVSVPAANGSVVINTQNPNINVNAILNASYGLSAGTYINQPTTALTGVGIGMTVNYTVLVGNDVIDSVSIYTPGTGYASGDQVTIPVGVPVSGAIFDITVGAPDTETWTFSQTGELLTPQGGRLGYAGKGWLGLDGGYGAPVSVTSYYANGFYAGCVSAYPDGNVGVTTYTGSENYSWNFDNTGALNLPIINNGPFGGFSGAIQTASAYPTLLAYGLGGHGGPELDWIDSDDPANTFSNSNTVRNTLYLNGNAGLYVGFNENGNTGPYTGHFQVDTLGNVQIPSQNVGNSTANGTPGEATYLRGTRKVINGVYTGAQNPFAVEIAAGPASTVAYTATNQSVQSVRVTFAVQSTGNGSCWEQFDVVATPSQDTPGTVNYVVSNRIKSTSTVTDTQVTATLNGANQIEISLVPMTGQNGWASFDAVEFGLMVD